MGKKEEQRRRRAKLKKNRNKQAGRDMWDFTMPHVDFYGYSHEPEFKGDVVARKFVPIGWDKQLNQNHPDFDNIIASVTPVMDRLLRGAGIHGANYNLTPSRQVYGVPDQKKLGENLRRYCEKIADFLANTHPDIYTIPIDWVCIEDGDDYSSGFDGKGFIGKTRYEVTIVRGKDTKTSRPDITSRKARLVTGSGGYMVPGPDDTSMNFLFISADEYAIISPFSELSHLTVVDACATYQIEEGIPAANLASETYAEGASHSIVKKYGDSLGLPEGGDYALKSMLILEEKPVYRHVHDSFDWINENGLEEAHALFTHSPREFMKAVGVYD